MSNWWNSLSNRIKDSLLALALMALAAALRLPGLTVFLTADEARSWFGRSIIFLDALLRLDLANTAPGGTAAFIEAVSLSPAPGVTTMWSGALGIALAWLAAGAPGSLPEFLVNLPFDPLNPAMLFWLRLPGALIAIAAVGLTFWWSRPLLGRTGALLAAAFIALDPFYLALSRVLGHDALVATFMWLSLLALLRVIQSTEYRIQSTDNKIHHSPFTIYHLPLPWLAISGAMAGLAWLSKYPALFIGAYTAAALLAAYLWQSRNSQFTIHNSQFTIFRRWFVAMLIWSAAAGAVVFLLWPAMWVNPLGPVGIIISDALRASGGAHPKGSFFLGQPVPDPGALFYPIVAVFRTTPVVFLGALLSLWLLLKPRPLTENSRLDARVPLLVLWGYVLLYTLLVTVGGKKQDRYLLPAFPALHMLAAMGYTYLLASVRPTRWRALLPASLIALQLLMVLPSYPYFFSYYNPLAGGSLAASRTMQMGWGEGLNEAADWLNTLPDAESTRVTSWYSTTFEPYFHGQSIYKIDDEKISRSAKPGLAADYVVLYLNQLQRRLPSEGVLAWFQRDEPAHVVALNGQPYAWIYAAPAVANIFAGEVRLVGQAELLGFDLLDAAGRRLEALPSNSAATLRLYWEWQGKSPDDPIGLSLVDDSGSTVGWANLIAPGQPITNGQPLDEESGAIAVSDYALAIFPGTPPGRYGLRAWIDRPASGEVVGQFPITPADAQVTVTPPDTPPAAADFEPDHASDAAFGPLRLLGYNFSGDDWQPGEARVISLFWEAVDAPTGDTAAALSLVSASAEIPAELSPRWEQGITPAHPTGQWQPGDIYRDNRTLTLPPTQPAGPYNLQLTVNGIEQTLQPVTVNGRERIFEPPPIANRRRVTVGDSIELLGYETAPGDNSLAVTLVWRATDTPPEDVTVFVQLLDAAGQVIAQNDSAPQGGAAPTGTWAAGEVVVDTHALALPGGIVPEGAQLIAGMYRPADGQRLVITDVSGLPTGDYLTLIKND